MSDLTAQEKEELTIEIEKILTIKGVNTYAADLIPSIETFYKNRTLLANEAPKQPDTKALALNSVVPSTLSDEEATKMLVNCPYEKRGWCNAENYKCRFKIDDCGNGGDGCELAL